MHSDSAEVVFSLSAVSNARTIIEPEAGLFRYSNGPVKVPGPWKRGRPKGSVSKASKLAHGDTKRRPSSSFEFVNISERSRDIDKATRSRIRRHAKLCQNRHDQMQLDIAVDQHQSENQISESVNYQVLKLASKVNLQQIFGVDPFDQSPIKLEPYMHDLLNYYTDTVWKNFYTLEYMAGYNPVTEYWLHSAFRDPALIHIFIACADAYSRGYRAIMSGTKGLRHFYEAISLVNQRIRKASDAVSETTLAIIAALATLEKAAGRHKNWRVHMQGLQGLVNRRGTLETQSLNPFVVTKIYRADLCGALDAGEHPYFKGPPSLLLSSVCEYPFRSAGLNAALETLNLDQSLRDCIHQLEEAMSLWSDLDGEAAVEQPIKSDSDNLTRINKPTIAQVARARQLLTEAQYILVSGHYQQSTVTSVQSDRLSEYFRITLILYSITILHEPALSQFIDRRIGDIFRRVYTDFMPSPDGSSSSLSLPLWPSKLPIDLHLWALFLAASVTDMITDSEIKTWLLVSFAKLTSPEYGDIRDWVDLRSRLRRYLWVPSIHDQSAWMFWLEVKKLKKEKPHSRNIIGDSTVGCI